jgi:U3 small nucleolar RNA-associated protein 14
MDFIRELDDIDGGDRVQTKTEEMEIARARERASLKHSTQGKWAKKVAGLKGLGSNANTAIQARIGREDLLKKKIAGQGSDHSDEDETDSDFDSEAEGDIDGMKAHALNQLSRVDSDTLTSNDPPAKGLFAMKFMQNAMAAKERKAEEAKAEPRQQLLEENHDSSGEKVQGNPGRLVFNPDVVSDPYQAKPFVAVVVDLHYLQQCRQVVGPTTAGNDTPTSNEDVSTHPAPYQTTKTSGSHLRVMASPQKSATNTSKSVPERPRLKKS